MLCSRKGISRSSCGLCSGGQGADGKGSDKFHFPIYIHFPFHASSWGTRRDGGKALKMKRGPNPVRFSRKGLQNSWKQSSPGFPRAPTRVSNPGGISGCAAGGFGLPLHSLQREQQIVTRAAGMGQTSLSCHCFTSDVTAGGTATESSF